MNKAFVSICMPAYNVEDVVGDALRSVQAQSYENLEIIVVDDASDDGTQEVVRSKSDRRIRYYRNRMNLGGYQTMNKALDLAKGELIAVYHADDIYEPTIVEKEVEYLTRHPEAGAVFCLDTYMDHSGLIYGGTRMPREFARKETLTYEEVFPFLMRRKNVLFRCPTFMTRRETLDRVGLFDAERYDIAADLDMWIRILRLYPIGIINEQLMRYRHGAQQWSTRYKKLRVDRELYFDVMDHYLAADDWLRRVHPRDVVEYVFHRRDDETFRAANLVISGDDTRAEALLNRPFPWQTLLNGSQRRKLRVVLLRLLTRAGLRLRANGLLRQFLLWSEYGQPLISPFS